MVVATASAPPADPSPGPDSREWRGQAFGLRVSSPVPLAGVAPAAEAGDGVREVRLSLVEAAELERRTGDRGARLFRQRLRDGRTVFEFEHHAVQGYRAIAPEFGVGRVSADGRSLDFAPHEGVPRWRWERFLAARLLPLAALLQGLEVFHASAVVIDGRLVAFAADSGVGKTSLALELVHRGARLFADDVLVLDPSCPRATCHPGVGAVNLRDRRLTEMAERGDAPFEAILGRAGRTVRALIHTERSARPLDRLYLIRRETGPREPLLRPIGTADRLLAATFNFAIRSPSRLARQLEGCANVAQAAAVHELVIPADHGARDTAAFVQRHAAG